MLLITRRQNEAIIINGAIELQVVEIKGGRVKLGVTYPKGNTVHRKELFVKIQEENQQAAKIDARHLSSMLLRTGEPKNEPHDD
jgi:carbon storage regulator